MNIRVSKHLKEELAWVILDAIIITACDSIQNPGQTWIFYNLGQTRLTQAKLNLVDPITQMTRPSFNPDRDLWDLKL